MATVASTDSGKLDEHSFSRWKLVPGRPGGEWEMAIRIGVHTVYLKPEDVDLLHKEIGATIEARS